MKNTFLNKNKKLTILVLVLFGATFTHMTLPFLNSTILKNDPSIFGDEHSSIDDVSPKSSEYQTYDGSGENNDVVLHQSLIDSTTKQFTDLDSSNIFNEPFPIFSGYNTSYIDISIDSINAPNKTLNLELGTTSNDQISWDLLSYSFRIRTTCLIQNLSIYLSESGGSGGVVDVKLFIYNATWNGAQSRIEPDVDTGVIDITESVPDEAAGQWYNYTINKQLDATNTYDNTFFVYVYQNTNPAVARAYYHYEAGSTSDNLITYRDSGGGWQEIARDISSQIILGLNDNTPVPTDINLQINGTAVTDIGITNTGSWTSTNAYEGLNGNLDFEVTADWWEVSCDVTDVQVNYTKSDVVANSDFQIPSSGQDAQWNVTIPSGLNYFDSRITDFNTINFTIPAIWQESTISVFNGGTDKTSDSFKRLLNKDYREIRVLNAANGTFWHLIANSSNLISSIDTYVNDIALSMVNYSNVLELNTTFTELIGTGSLNLSVFSPVPRNVNHTTITPISSLNNEFQANWDISTTANNYGVFKIQASWNNDTAAGFLEDYITIIADTDITLNAPLAVYDSSDIFDLSVFYNDIGQTLGIDADQISYQIGGGPVRTDNITPLGGGYYNITLSCSDADFSYGPNTIEVNAEKTYYNNQTDSVAITILAETSANIIYPLPNAVFDSGDTFDLAIQYDDTVQATGIVSATIEYSLDGGSTYRTDNVAYIGSGQYNITISASDSDFNGYGANSIMVDVSRQYYYNHSESVNINLLGETTPITPVRIPNKAYYTAAETFNISFYYEDNAKTIGISGGIVTVDVGGTVYNPPALTDYGDGNYDMIIDCSAAIFNSYGVFPIRINVSKSTYYNQSYILNTLIVGNESLTVIAPNSGAIYIEGQSFDIAVEYIDTILTTGIAGATIEYSLDGGSTYRTDNVAYIGSGQYNITIDVSDSDFLSNGYGFVDIEIDASKQYYENRSTSYNFHRQITTQITPNNAADLGSVIKGLNVSYVFNYADTSANDILQASWTRLSTPVGFSAWLENLGNGDYEMHLETTNVIVTGLPYVYQFSIYAIGNETQILSLTVNVLIIQTEIIDVTNIPEIARNSGLNQSVRFYLNDTTNDLPVLNVITSNIFVRNQGTGTLFNTGEFWLYNPSNNGTYILDITMGNRDSGWYTLEINASRFPNYNWSLYEIRFYYRGNYTTLNLVALSDPGGALTPTGNVNFTIFEGSDLAITFNITDDEYLDNLIIGDVDSYLIQFTNLVTFSSGTLTDSLNFISTVHTGSLLTSNPLLTPGSYLINITTTRINYEESSLLFNLTIIGRYLANLTVLYKPTVVTAGNDFQIIIQAEYFNGAWINIVGSEITIIPHFNGIAAPALSPIATNTSGQVQFEITIRSDANRMNLTIQLQSEYYHQAFVIYVADIRVNRPFSIEDLIPYFIMAGAAIVVVGASIGVYRGVIVPKKREKQRVLSEVKTLFDDAINLEHILVLYKGTGTCIFFKSYGSEQIDPELIGGFLTAVSSFGKEMVAQESLNEISYGDKMLLLADGELIRVALVLGKKASLILRSHLKEFIEDYEKIYKDVLPGWRGQLNYFRNSGQIVDDEFNTSIILPHQITYDFAKAKDLKNPHSKEILKVAHSCCEETEREFFFIATLLKESTERTGKDTAEIFMGIKELRDKKILIPIEITAIEAQPVSQQEINLINQKVSQLTNLADEEKHKLVADLAQLGPIEREAYLSSLVERQEIVSAPIKTQIGSTVIENKKSAKRAMQELVKRGKIATKKKKYDKALELLQDAALVASNWKYSNEFLQIEEIIRKVKIEDLTNKKKTLEQEAKEAVKNKKYNEAAGKYKYASKMASEIFKLGATEMTKEVKRLTNKANEYEKLK